MTTSNSDAAGASNQDTNAAAGLLWTDDGETISEEAASNNDHMSGIQIGVGDSEPDRKKSPLHSEIESVPAKNPSDDLLLDKSAEIFSREIDDIFHGLGNVGTSVGGKGGDQADVFANISHLTKDPGKERDVVNSTHVAVDDMSTTSTQDNSAKSNMNEKPAIAATTPIVPIDRRNSRRHRTIRQMESISETGSEIIISSAHSEEAKEFEDGNEFIEDFFDQDNDSEHLVMVDNSNDNLDVRRSNSQEITAPASTSSSFLTPRRRRVRASGGSVASAGDNSNSTGTGSGRGSRGSGRRFRRGGRHSERSNHSAHGDDEHREDNDNIGRRGRSVSSGNGNTLVASLDAGMVTLRRWIRARRLSFGSGTGAGSSSGHSVSSMTTMRLGEEDIFALSHTGSDPRRITSAAASTSSDPNSNIFESNSNSGFLYYRPFEVHVHHDVDMDSGIYGSDDESGTRSILLHPLVPSTESSSIDEGSQQSRQRAHSEPDRARVVDFFSSVYGSRAIDGGYLPGETAAAGRSLRGNRTRRHTQHRSSSMRPVEEERDVTYQNPGPNGERPLTPNAAESSRLQLLSPLDGDGEPSVPALSAPRTTTSPPSSPSSRNVPELPTDEPVISSNNDITDIDTNDTLHEGTSSISDPNQQARIRWIRINRRFRCIITSVAVLFSLLLFFIVIAWVLLISTYVLSHNKQCDVPLKEYFWLVSIQLMLDIFRADIMKWLCRWRTDSGRRIPPRVILYNAAYLIYAMVVLRIGVQSVFVTKTSCHSTAPELFYASLAFVCLSLMAWATILLGYLIPFCFVAVLLTRNGYFPNGDISSSRGVMGGRRARIGTGRISDMVGEVFPNTCSNPAPPGCVERLRVVLLHELPESYQKECCICMAEYTEGEVIVATPCDHVFHKRCCQEWLQLSRTCPVCRTDLPEALGYEGTSGEEHSLSGSEEMRGQASNLMRYLRRERRQPADDTSNHPGDIAVIELAETPNSLSYLESGRNESTHSEQIQQLDA